MPSSPDWLIHLDRKVSSGDLVKSYDPSTNRTTFTLPYRISAPMAVVVAPQGGESIDNEAPEVDAGDPITADEGAPVVMAATVTDDSQPVIHSLTYLWEKVSGPGDVTFDDETSLNPTVTIEDEGEYVLKLTATDRAFTVSDTVTITIEDPVPSYLDVHTDGPVFVTKLSLDGTKVYIGGLFDSVTDASGTYTRSRAACLDLSTGLFTSWNPNVGNTGTFYVFDIEETASQIYLAGLFQTVGGTSRTNIASVNKTTGALNTAFNCGTGSGGSQTHAAVATAGYLYLGTTGSLNDGTTTRSNLMRVDLTTGAIDSWNPNPGVVIKAILLDGSDLYVGGPDAVTAYLKKFNATSGVEDGTFVSDYDGQTLQRLVAYGSTILVGGGNVGTTPLRAVSKTTGLMTAWAPTFGSSKSVYGLGVDADRVFIGTDSTTLAGASRNKAGVVSAIDGTIDAWDAQFTATPPAVYDWCFVGDIVFAGGYFTNVGPLGTTHGYFGAFDKTTGTLV